MAKEYVHEELGKEVVAIAGNYAAEREERLAVKGREVLYVVGRAMFDTTCCGVGGCGYAFVPGYILSWKKGESVEGRPVSEVEPIEDLKLRSQIEERIKKSALVQQVQFLEG